MTTRPPELPGLKPPGGPFPIIWSSRRLRPATRNGGRHFGNYPPTDQLAWQSDPFRRPALTVTRWAGLKLIGRRSGRACARWIVYISGTHKRVACLMCLSKARARRSARQ